MKQFFVILSMVLLATTPLAARKMKSPNGRLTLTTEAQGIRLSYQGQQVLDIPVVGYGTSGALDFQSSGKIEADYHMLIGKRLHCTNRANEYVAALSPTQAIRVRLYDDGLAFRYELRGLQHQRLPEEQTTYRIPEGTRRWFLHWTDGYEDFYPLATSGKEPEQWPFFDRRNDHNRWGFPALMQPREGVFVLLTEANIERQQSAASLFNNQDPELYRLRPEQNELTISGEWHTPWRLAITGTLADVVQSTLVTDVSEPSQLTDTSWIHPGVVSWIYWANNHGSNDYDIIKKYVDMAVTLKLPYVLIDAEWDEMKDGKTIEDAVAYARERNIKPLIWYNSSVGWINGAPGPKFRLNKPEDREREFAWCEQIGVAGVKIDFFSGDDQRNMDYCIDLLESAARHHLTVNFHGAPIPRGWQRTYPNLLSTEGVYGAEWYNNVPTFTARAAAHNATLPFTRNVVGPMDYTPCAFSDSQHPHITTHAHELALTVLYESGLQHLADRPESFLAQPQPVQQFLSQLPTVWDETHLVSGYPADHAIIARRSGDTWYVAGINGTKQPRDLDLSNLRAIVGSRVVTNAFLDADEDRAWQLQSNVALPANVHTRARGGFVLVIH
jgi:hypothetical protein